jgi:hypothetical protein
MGSVFAVAAAGSAMRDALTGFEEVSAAFVAVDGALAPRSAIVTASPTSSASAATNHQRPPIVLAVSGGEAAAKPFCVSVELPVTGLAADMSAVTGPIGWVALPRRRPSSAALLGRRAGSFARQSRMRVSSSAGIVARLDGLGGSW